MDKGIIVLKKHNYPSQSKWNNHANIQTWLSPPQNPQTMKLVHVQQNPHLVYIYSHWTHAFTYSLILKSWILFICKTLCQPKRLWAKEDDNSCFHPNQSSCSHQPINQTCQIKGSYKQPCGASLNITLNQSFTTHQWTTLQRLSIQVDMIMIHSSNLKGRGDFFLFIFYCQCVPKMFPLGSKSVPQVPIVLPSKMFPIAPHLKIHIVWTWFNF